ncbi:glycosyltransferase family 2 protein [Rhodococcoides yunnanense]|uniref:glycosyltransferase family 2 protein n=1 Tax=Rhodococcoides yunnanense TaxID=278209 RepID=UPI000933231A|nr:glycosyltransferase family 2 protein [Rhodococcus yunnanensis]
MSGVRPVPVRGDGSARVRPSGVGRSLRSESADAAPSSHAPLVKLSIVMPVYNEERTIGLAIERVLAVEFDCAAEIIVVDDGSTDATPRMLGALARRGVVVITHSRNYGKGTAVVTGIRSATGSHLIILDADLEYAPADIPSLLAPVVEGRADHVFGVRVFGVNSRFPSLRYAYGGRATTLVANLLYDSCLTDMHTCLKLIPVSHFRALALHEGGFGLDTELTARLLRSGVRPFEVPVSYCGRSAREGKKITWRDGVHCLSVLFKVRIERHPIPLPPLIIDAKSDDAVPDSPEGPGSGEAGSPDGRFGLRSRSL